MRGTVSAPGHPPLTTSSPSSFPPAPWPTASSMPTVPAASCSWTPPTRPRPRPPLRLARAGRWPSAAAARPSTPSMPSLSSSSTPCRPSARLRSASGRRLAADLVHRVLRPERPQPCPAVLASVPRGPYRDRHHRGHHPDRWLGAQRRQPEAHPRGGGPPVGGAPTGRHPIFRACCPGFLAPRGRPSTSSC